MKASSLFKEYVWLVNTIRRAGRITLREINERWLRTEMSDGIPFSRTTFRRHRAEVVEMFDIIIDCDGENRYYIEDTDLFREDSVQRWMLGTLAVSNIVSEARGLHERLSGADPLPRTLAQGAGTGGGRTEDPSNAPGGGGVTAVGLWLLAVSCWFLARRRRKNHHWPAFWCSHIVILPRIIKRQDYEREKQILHGPPFGRAQVSRCGPCLGPTARRNAVALGA